MSQPSCRSVTSVVELQAQCEEGDPLGKWSRWCEVQLYSDAERFVKELASRGYVKKS